MHDISVAQAVADGIIQKLEGKTAKRIEIDLGVGKLRFHDTGQVSFWINEILKKEFGPGLKVKTTIEVIEPGISCECGFLGPAGSIEISDELAHHGIYEIECPKCGSHEIEIEKGNECLIREVRVS